MYTYKNSGNINSFIDVNLKPKTWNKEQEPKTPNKNNVFTRSSVAAKSCLLAPHEKLQ